MHELSVRVKFCAQLLLCVYAWNGLPGQAILKVTYYVLNGILSLYSFTLRSFVPVFLVLLAVSVVINTTFVFLCM